MARRESEERNTLKVRDNLSGSDITLFYRIPTTKERQDFQNMSIQRKRNRVEFNQAAARLKYGMKILTGFEEGDFERKVDGGYQSFSWQESRPNYYPEWREWVQRHASDLVMLLGAHVFEASAMIDGDDDQGAGGDGSDAESDIEGK